MEVTFESYKNFKGYVINLDREKERYDTTKEILQTLGFSNIHRWKAVDYKEEDPEQGLQDIGVHTFNYFKNKAEMALFLSHYRIWATFLAGSDPHCFVFEDDVVGVDNFKEVADFKNLSYGEFDLLFFGGIFLDSVDTTGNRKNLPLLETKRDQGNLSFLKDSFFWQTHAYLLSREGAYKALRYCVEWINSSSIHKQPQVDNYLAHCKELKVLLAANSNIEKIERYSMADIDCPAYGRLSERICGILLQEGGRKSTVQFTEKENAQLTEKKEVQSTAHTTKTPVTFDSYRDFKGYVINLDREKWRYDVARKKLTQEGFSNIERFSASDYGNEDVNKELRRLGATRLERFVNDAEVAVVLSHFRAIHAFLAGRDEYCFIFEDDVTPIEGFRNKADLNDIYYEDFDLLCFGGIYAGTDYRFWSQGYSGDISELESAQAQKKTHLTDCSFFQMHAYMINRNAAYRLIQNYVSWASSEQYVKPHIDVYIPCNRLLRNKLLINNDIPNIHKYSFSNKFPTRICGLMLQAGDFKSTIAR